MSYRPYPNADRALRQVARHADEADPIGEPRKLSPTAEAIGRWAAAMRAAQPSGREFAAGLAAAFAPPVDEYRLSTR